MQKYSVSLECLNALIDILHEKDCSCVLYKDNDISLYYQKGVRDLFSLLNSDPEKLHGAIIFDKVIGKGAAALMILGKVKAVYADVISQPALNLFEEARMEVLYETLVPNIINRTGTGICPVESLCMNCHTAEECLPPITQFINNTNNK